MNQVLRCGLEWIISVSLKITFFIFFTEIKHKNWPKFFETVYKILDEMKRKKKISAHIHLVLDYFYFSIK